MRPRAGCRCFAPGSRFAATNRSVQVRNSRRDRGTSCSRPMPARGRPPLSASKPATAELVSIVMQPCGPFQMADPSSYGVPPGPTGSDSPAGNPRAQPGSRDSPRPRLTPSSERRGSDPNSGCSPPHHPHRFSDGSGPILQQNRFDRQKRPYKCTPILAINSFMSSQTSRLAGGFRRRYEG